MPPEELARRVRGAQLPQTGVVPLRNGGGADGGPAPVSPRPPDRPPARPASTPGLDRASAVQALLTNFTAGVQRGLAEARRQPVYPGSNGTGH
jgi:hypothetical protein